MPKVHRVKSARKARPEHGIEVGDAYFWWKFRFGGKHFSKTYPKRSQLTQSGFYASLYDLEDSIESRLEQSAEGPENYPDEFDRSGLRGEIDDIIGELEGLKDECQESLDNIPEQLQEADSGQLLQERIDALEGWINELNSVDTDNEDSSLEDIIAEVTECQPDIP